MKDVPFGLSFAEIDEGYALRRKEADGSVVTINLSEADVLGLQGTIQTWRDRIVPDVQGGSGLTNAVVAYPAVQIRILSDALGANVLLTIVTPSREQITLSLPLEISGYLVEELPDLLAQMRTTRPVRQ